MICAIDPDLLSSGVAIFDDEKKLSYAKLEFPDLIEFVKNANLVLIEGGWLNAKSNFHYSPNNYVAQRIAKNVGENLATGKLIVKCLQYYNVKYKIIKPLKKVWMKGKISNQELNQLLTAKGFAPLKRSNQDERDAMLLLLTYVI